VGAGAGMGSAVGWIPRPRPGGDAALPKDTCRGVSSPLPASAPAATAVAISEAAAAFAASSSLKTLLLPPAVLLLLLLAVLLLLLLVVLLLPEPLFTPPVTAPALAAAAAPPPPPRRKAFAPPPQLPLAKADYAQGHSSRPAARPPPRCRPHLPRLLLAMPKPT
jgi:hypothetical protein